MDRRAYLATAAGIFLAGCTTTNRETPTESESTTEEPKTTQPTETTRPPIDSRDLLIERLSSAEAGSVVTVPPDAEIDLSGHWELSVPPGVTLDGGRDVSNGIAGALLESPAGDETPEYNPNIRKIELEENARITGFRLEGHFHEYVNPATEHDGDYYAHLGGGAVTAKEDTVVDNNEISGWPYAGITVKGNAHIHDNDIHHNTWEGLGYGIAVPDGNQIPVIESNYFNYNRHSISASGSSAGYVARHNVVGDEWVGSQFDVHGTEGMQGVAGDRIVIEQNTFKATTAVEAKTRNPNGEYPAVDIRGTPTDGAWIEQNWFYHEDKESAVRQPDPYENVTFEANHYGKETPEATDIGAPKSR